MLLARNCPTWTFVFSGTSIKRQAPQCYLKHTSSHFHCCFGFPKGSNKSCGISFMLRRSRFDERKVVSAVSPDHDDIMSRVAIMRYKNGRENIALLGTYFPPRPTGAVQQKEYWRVCDLMLSWIREQTQRLPSRCMLLSYGDINDDLGLCKQGSNFVDVRSPCIGDNVFLRGQEQIRKHTFQTMLLDNRARHL